MTALMKTINTCRPARMLTAILFSVICLGASVFAQENDREILNKLYREIIGSSQSGISFKPDSVQPAAGAPLVAGDSLHVQSSLCASQTDPTSEQLKREIEKMVQEAQTRHSEAIEFMQDTR